MPDSRSPESLASYTATARFLHWSIALFLAGGFLLGAYMADLPVSPARIKLFNYHKWIGITVLGLALLRVLWRITHRPPPELPMPAWQLRTAQATHLLLYVLMIATPLVGWLYSSAAGFPVVYLKIWQLPDLVHKDRDLAKTLVEVHSFLAWSIGALVVLHVGAALKHHFVDRDRTLERMGFLRATPGGERR